MNHGDALVVALGATMALMLAGRSLRNARFSFRAKAAMVLAWVALIIGGALIAAWWQG